MRVILGEFTTVKMLSNARCAWKHTFSYLLNSEESLQQTPFRGAPLVFGGGKP